MRNDQPLWNRNMSREDQIVISFNAFEKLINIYVRPLTKIFSFQDMHEGIYWHRILHPCLRYDPKVTLCNMETISKVWGFTIRD